MTTDRDQHLHRLAETLAADPALLLPGWTTLVVVSRIEAGTPDMTGFCYTEDGRAVPVSPQDFAVFDVLEDLREAMATADDGPAWLAAMVRVERATGALSAQFEYHHPDRWAVTPANVRERAREFATPER